MIQLLEVGLSNFRELAPVDVLSDHVYYFDRDEGYRMAC